MVYTQSEIWVPVCIHPWSCPFTLSGDFVCTLYCYESWLLSVTLWLYCVIQLSWVITVRPRICQDTCLSSASSPTSLRALKKMSPNITSNTSKNHRFKLTLAELWPTLSLYFYNQIFLSAHYIAVRNLPQWRSLVDFTYGLMNIHEHCVSEHAHVCFLSTHCSVCTL